MSDPQKAVASAADQTLELGLLDEDARARRDVAHSTGSIVSRS